MRKHHGLWTEEWEDPLNVPRRLLPAQFDPEEAAAALDAETI
jgi:hypothetical protein